MNSAPEDRGDTGRLAKQETHPQHSGRYAGSNPALPSTLRLGTRS